MQICWPTPLRPSAHHARGPADAEACFRHEITQWFSSAHLCLSYLKAICTKIMTGWHKYSIFLFRCTCTTSVLPWVYMVLQCISILFHENHNAGSQCLTGSCQHHDTVNLRCFLIFCAQGQIHSILFLHSSRPQTTLRLMAACFSGCSSVGCRMKGSSWLVSRLILSAVTLR